MKITIDSEQNLIEAIATSFPNSSKNKLRKMLTEGRITVNGEIEHKAKRIVIKSDIIEVLDKSVSKELTPPPVHKPKNLNIIFEDEDILLVEKPAGLLSVATNKMEDDTLHSRCVDYVKSKDPKNWCFIVHRLDRETSGIMLLALSKQNKEYLQEQFANRDVHRVYHALVEGKPDNESGTIREWLLEDKFLKVKSVKKNHPKAKEAITHYNVVDFDEFASLVQLTIETGRRHQIRVGLANLGCPVVGDEAHGAEGNPIGRIALHASSLEFLHPETDDPVRFEAPIPFGPE